MGSDLKSFFRISRSCGSQLQRPGSLTPTLLTYDAAAVHLLLRQLHVLHLAVHVLPDRLGRRLGRGQGAGGRGVVVHGRAVQLVVEGRHAVERGLGARRGGGVRRGRGDGGLVHVRQAGLQGVQLALQVGYPVGKGLVGLVGGEGVESQDVRGRKLYIYSSSVASQGQRCMAAEKTSSYPYSYIHFRYYKRSFLILFHFEIPNSMQHVSDRQPISTKP